MRYRALLVCALVTLLVNLPVIQANQAQTIAINSVGLPTLTVDVEVNDSEFHVHMDSETNSMVISKSQDGLLPLMTGKVTEESGLVKIEYQIGEDLMEIIYDADPDKTLEPGGMLTFRLNEGLMLISNDDLLAAGQQADRLLHYQPGLFFEANLKNPLTFGVAFSEVTTVLGDDGIYPAGCWGCAGTLIMYGLSLSALIAACGIPAGWFCVSAFLAMWGVKLALIEACIDCVNGRLYLDEDPTTVQQRRE